MNIIKILTAAGLVGWYSQAVEFGFLTFSHQKSVVEKTSWGEPD